MPDSSPRIVDISVIIPTYKEAENLAVLIPRIASHFDCAGGHAEIVVVDDDSRDGTEQVCEELGREYPVRLVTRKDERGLSTAVIRGMREAKGTLFVVMDADLSHPPESIPALVDALCDGEVDMAIGSRYVEGGSTEQSWGLFRRINSRVATLMARPLVNISDPMAGFFAIRRSTVAQADKLNPVGYKIALELIVKCNCRRIKEVPIVFRNRRFGTSKLTFAEQVKYALHITRLLDYKYKKWTCFVKFCAVGATGMVVDLAAYSLLLAILPLVIARAIAIWLAMSWNFFLNRRFTFRGAADTRRLRQYVMFCGSCGAGALLNWTISVSLPYAVAFLEESPLLCAVAGIAAGTGFNYTFSRKWTFQAKK